MSSEMSEPIIAGDGRAGRSAPSNVLILSASLGEGHNAAAAAITASMAEVWPGCRVERFDTLELCGKPFARAAKWGYGFQMRVVPQTYEKFYGWLSQWDWFAAVAKVVIGRFLGRRLEGLLADRQVDLVISTYPFASAALHWMRTRRGYDVPLVTYVPAFHVHPCWTYSGIDQHYVMYDTAAGHARTAGFESTMRIGAPPVRDGFGTVHKDEARRRLRLDDDVFIVLVTGGAWGLGNISDSVRSLIGLSENMKVIAVCGQNAELVERLNALDESAQRLSVLGYVENMHELMAAADVVVTNGAGVTVLEALRTPRPVIAFRPLAGHGKASTAEMVRRDLSAVAEDVPSLVSVVQRLASDEALMARMERAGRIWAEGRDLRDSVRGMEELFPAGPAQGRDSAI